MEASNLHYSLVSKIQGDAHSSLAVPEDVCPFPSSCWLHLLGFWGWIFQPADSGGMSVCQHHASDKSKWNKRHITIRETYFLPRPLLLLICQGNIDHAHQLSFHDLPITVFVILHQNLVCTCRPNWQDQPAT